MKPPPVLTINSFFLITSYLLSVPIKKINIYGASGHAKVILDIIASLKDVEVGYVFDDNEHIKSLLGFALERI